MKRKDFLRHIGTAGLGAIAITKSAATAPFRPDETLALPPVCTIIPSETQGPYQLNLSNNSSIWRSNILEAGTDGSGAGAIPMVFTLTIQNLDCVPIPNLRVDFWHCNEHGYYSGFNGQNGYQGTKNYAGQTWMRGIQCTNSAGEVTFETIYPGWYVGRVQHIHFQIYSAGSCNSGSGWTLQRTSQIAFPDTVNTAVNSTPPYSSHGQNPISNGSDNVFSDGFGLQLAAMSGSPSSGYVGSMMANIEYVVVPLELVAFNGGKDNGRNNLWWTTLNEINLSHFELEHSTDGKAFTTIGHVKAHNALGPNNYAFADWAMPDENVYYRLRSVDFDGKYELSEVVAINGQILSGISISPMPAKEYLLLRHPKSVGNYAVKILSMDGRTVATGLLPDGSSETRLDVSLLRNGIYLLMLEGGAEKHVLKFIKN